MPLRAEGMNLSRVIAAACACASLSVALPARAAVFTDLTAFDNAAAAASIPLTTDNFSTYPLGNISNGQTLGKFAYTFDPNLNDPTGTQPVIGLDGTSHVLTGGPFGAFVGGNSVTLTFTGGKTLLAFGAMFTYAPANEDLLAGLYDLAILDGTGATTIGNPAGLSADGGSFFLGFIGSPAQVFSQTSLSSLVDPPNGVTGSPFLIPGYEINDLVFGSAAGPSVPEPGSLGLLAVGLTMAAFAMNRSRRPKEPSRMKGRML
jgi:hypothetical protein